LKVVTTKLTDDEYQALLERVRKEGVSIADFASSSQPPNTSST
jgi:hypothetical protein